MHEDQEQSIIDVADAYKSMLDEAAATSMLPLSTALLNALRLQGTMKILSMRIDVFRKAMPEIDKQITALGSNVAKVYFILNPSVDLINRPDATIMQGMVLVEDKSRVDEIIAIIKKTPGVKPKYQGKTPHQIDIELR